MKKIALVAMTLCFAWSASAQKEFKITSPNGRVTAEISLDNQLTYSISLDGEEVMDDSPIGVTLTTGEVWGSNPKLKSKKTKKVDQMIPSPFYRANQLRDNYNELTLTFKDDYGVEFRAYNDGIAYRLITTRKTPFIIQKDNTAFDFDDDDDVIASYVREDYKAGDFTAQFGSSFENLYSEYKVKDMKRDRLTFLPVMVKTDDGVVCITETNLESYPGLYLLGTGSGKMQGINAPYPKTMKQGGHNMLQEPVSEGENFIAKINGPRTFPWRIAIVAKEDKDIAASTLGYQLGEPSRVADYSWVKPGKVAWDWWNDWNIGGVDFRAGINTETYKYYIDFASQKGIEYVILDEGWAVNLKADLLQIIPEIDLKGIVEYGKQKGVGIILWAGYYAFNRDMENVCKHYSDMGVKGFKIDFMDRDDQLMTEFMYRAAATCAKYHMLADFHGTYKPSGLNRTYPNVVNFEGVHGLEQMKWESGTDQLKYDVTIPYIRQVAGPMDYTQGAMLNGGIRNYHPFNSEPMSQGTRCHQLGLYVVLDSPLNMLCDSPTNYLKEPECTDFIAKIPTVWDETRIIDGKVGEYIVTARRSGNTWYVGGITNREPRDLTIDLSFLSGKQMQLFKDGVNADRKGSDFKLTNERTESKLQIHLAPGGGFAAKIQ